jgi:non-ribosomal peptide synthetase component F
VIVAPAQLAALTRLARQHQASLYMVLASAFAVLLSRYTGQEDLVIGSPIANRPDPQLEHVIGCFVDTLVVRVRLRPGSTFAELLADVRQTTLDAYRYQDVPLERLVQIVAPDRTANNAPLVQVVFGLQNAPWTPPRLPDVTVEYVSSGDPQARVDLEVHAWETGGRLHVSWLWSRDLFDRWRMEQMAQHYLDLLETVAADAEQPL